MYAFENFDAFFRLNAFAEAVKIGASGAEYTISAIFDADYYEMADSYGGVSMSQPKITCKTSDVAAIEQGARIVVRGVQYRVIEHQPNGTGISEVFLNRL